MALRQAALSNHLKELNAQLAVKIHLANRITQDQLGSFSLAKVQHDATVAELEKQIVALQKEKEDLAQLLAQSANSVNACKISEQRRKRLQELEPQIADLRKKVQEQANIIKIKRKLLAFFLSFNTSALFVGTSRTHGRATEENQRRNSGYEGTKSQAHSSDARGEREIPRLASAERARSDTP